MMGRLISCSQKQEGWGQLSLQWEQAHVALNQFPSVFLKEVTQSRSKLGFSFCGFSTKSICLHCFRNPTCGRCTRKGVGTSSQPETASVSNTKISSGKPEFTTSYDSGQSPSNATESFFYTSVTTTNIFGNWFGFCAQWTRKGWQSAKDSSWLLT